MKRKELLERLRLAETIVYDMADLTRPCQIVKGFRGARVCLHIPDRIINSDVGCVFGLALEYRDRFPSPGKLIQEKK